MSEEKTFTQEEVNQIVQERLQREKNKQPELERREKELAKREKAFEAKQLIKENNLPESFSNLLEGSEDMGATVKLLLQGMEEHVKGIKPKIIGARPGESSDNRPDASETLEEAFGLYD
ncbi:MAG: hypothetical protein HFE72_06455 [Emergencia sp.]|nr:hypothetical protein [Emergencia sp.]